MDVDQLLSLMMTLLALLFIFLNWDRPSTEVKSWCDFEVHARITGSIPLLLLRDVPEIPVSQEAQHHHLLEDHMEGLLRDRKGAQRAQLFQPSAFGWVFWLRPPKDQHPHCASLDLLTCTVCEPNKQLFCLSALHDLLCHRINWNRLYASWAGRR